MRQRRRRNIIQEAPKSIGDQLPSLALFVMLLAFFMVLNSISAYEEHKTQNIMQSLDDTFASKITEVGNDKPSVTQSVEKQLGEGDAIERIDALFKSHISGYKVVKNKQRGMMQMQVAREEFEDALRGIEEGKTDSGFGSAFLPTLVSIMRTEERGTPYRVEITYYVDENPARIQNQEPGRMAEIIRNAGSIAREIEMAGLHARLMTIGLQKGDPKMVELVFQKHVPFNPVKENTLKDPVGGDANEQEIRPE